MGIFLYNGVEVLDFAEPFAVFSTESRLLQHEGADASFGVFTFSNIARVVTARGGLKVVPDYTFKNVPNTDILVVQEVLSMTS